MKILIVPDKFKGGLGSQEVASIIAEALKGNLNHLPAEGAIDIDVVSMADGGDGSAPLFQKITKAEKMECLATGALGERISASYMLAATSGKQTAFIESASVCGLAMLPEKLHNPLKTTTFGIGEIIADALRRGAERIIVGVGGTSTNDCGSGMLQALGAVFRTKQGAFGGYNPQGHYMCGEFLSEIESLDFSPVAAQHKNVEFLAVSDVQSPLIGPCGAARCFAKQKGADSAAIEKLEMGAKNLISICGTSTDFAGSGAGGGLGFALGHFLGAKMISGFEYFAFLQNLSQKIFDADMIISAEGKIDQESLRGKVVGGLLRRISNYNDNRKRAVWLFCGKSEISKKEIDTVGNKLGAEFKIFEMNSLEPNIKVRLKRERELLRQLVCKALSDKERA